MTEEEKQRTSSQSGGDTRLAGIGAALAAALDTRRKDMVEVDSDAEDDDDDDDWDDDDDDDDDD